MADRLMPVFTNPVEGQDDAFNEWYDSRHLVDVLNVPGVVAAQRYDLAPMTLPQGDDLPAQLPPAAHRYLTIYELDRDPDAVMKEFVNRAGTDQMLWATRSTWQRFPWPPGKPAVHDASRTDWLPTE